jgi:polyisoprenoid-binding protein YceI
VFGVKHTMFTTVKGRFAGVSGTIEVSETTLANSSVNVEIDATMIDTRGEKRDAHLRSTDFFDVDQYPTIAFRSTRVEPTRGDTFRVVGDLTAHRLTHEVALDVERTGQGTNPWG